MNKRQQKEYYTTLDVLRDVSKLATSEVAWMLDRLHRYETTLNRINENECNGHPRKQVEYIDGKMYVYDVEDLEWKARDEKKEEKTQAAVRRICEKLGVQVDFEGDPRGCCIRMKLPNKKYNSWDGESWVIDW